MSAGANRKREFRAMRGELYRLLRSQRHNPWPCELSLSLSRWCSLGDRENNRIQLFDQTGKFIDEWRQFGRPSGIVITKDDRIYVAYSESYGTDTDAHELPGSRRASASAAPATEA
jgi:hypothetical protein